MTLPDARYEYDNIGYELVQLKAVLFATLFGPVVGAYVAAVQISVFGCNVPTWMTGMAVGLAAAARLHRRAIAPLERRRNDIRNLIVAFEVIDS